VSSPNSVGTDSTATSGALLEVGYRSRPAANFERANYWIDVTLFGFFTLNVLVYFTSIIPHFEPMFADFRTALPPTTAVFVAISHVIRDDFGRVLFLPVPFLLALSLRAFRRYFHMDKKPRIILRAAKFFVVYMMIATLLSFPLFMPLIKLMQAVGRGGDGGQ